MTTPGGGVYYTAPDCDQCATAPQVCTECARDAALAGQWGLITRHPDETGPICQLCEIGRAWQCGTCWVGNVVATRAQRRLEGRVIPLSPTMRAMDREAQLAAWRAP